MVAPYLGYVITMNIIYIGKLFIQKQQQQGANHSKNR